MAKARAKKVKSGYVEYSSNNSGGSWWLKDEDWIKLEKAGWEVQWGQAYFCGSKHQMASESLKPKKACPKGKCNGHHFKSYKDMTEKDRWLGSLATSAIKRNTTMKAAALEWETVLNMRATDAGCACCGQPHRFTEYDANGQYVNSGPETSYEARW